MRVIFMGRKPAASRALAMLVERGFDVAAVVAPIHPAEPNHSTFWRPLLRHTARDLGIPVIPDAVLYRSIAAAERGETPEMDLGQIDLVLSVLFWKKIKHPLITLPRLGCFNFHPGPLPEFRGRRGYNFAILEAEPEYGVSSHWVADGFDTGDLVEVRRFPIRPDETALSLEQRTMGHLLEIFDDFLVRRVAGEPIPRITQSEGKSATKQQMLEASIIHPDDDPETIARKVRAFWYPPHPGARINLGGAPYTLVDDATLAKLGRFIHGSGETPF